MYFLSLYVSADDSVWTIGNTIVQNEKIMILKRDGRVEGLWFHHTHFICQPRNQSSYDI